MGKVQYPENWEEETEISLTERSFPWFRYHIPDERIPTKIRLSLFYPIRVSFKLFFFLFLFDFFRARLSCGSSPYFSTFGANIAFSHTTNLLN